MAYLAQTQADKKEEHAKRFAEWLTEQHRKSTFAVLTDEAQEEVHSFLLGKTASSKVVITITLKIPKSLIFSFTL